jgi:hypothetical protein
MCTHIPTYTRTHTHTYTYKLQCIHANIHTVVSQSSLTYIHTYIHTHSCNPDISYGCIKNDAVEWIQKMHMHILVHTHIWLLTCKHTYIHAVASQVSLMGTSKNDAPPWIKAYIRVHTHTCILTCTHTCSRKPGISHGHIKK